MTASTSSEPRRRSFFARVSLARAFAPAMRNMQYIRRRTRALSLTGIVGFPLYYYIWHDVFPQHYENLPLRLAGAVLFVPTLFCERWPVSLQRFLPWYWYTVLVYALPFFFTFMLLKNHGSDVWVQSALVAAFVMVLQLDWLMLVLQFVAGVALAVIAYYLTTAHPAFVGIPYLEHLMIFCFAIGVGSLANYDLERIRIEQERAMLATASSVAHELRTPLLAIRAGAVGLTRYLPSLLEAYAIAQHERLPVPRIRMAHLHALQGVVTRIEREALHSNTMIDMLLTNARVTAGIPQSTSRCSIEQCVTLALARYPFREHERQRVHTDLADEFEFIGSEVLIIHVLFNLLKNALQHMSPDDNARVSIHANMGPRYNELVFLDTGPGISPDVLPHIFTRFYTSSTTDDVSAGAGIGLAFCHDVMNALGGSISCTSVKNEYTRFVLKFPLS